MKTAHLVIGVALIISSGIIGLFLVSQMGVSCAQAPQSILCTSAGPLILASGVGGLIFFLILGVVVLWAGRERPLQVTPVSTSKTTEGAQQAVGLFEFGFPLGVVTFAAWSAISIQALFFPICLVPTSIQCLELQILVFRVAQMLLIASFIFIFVSLWGLRRNTAE